MMWFAGNEENIIRTLLDHSGHLGPFGDELRRFGKETRVYLFVFV